MPELPPNAGNLISSLNSQMDKVNKIHQRQANPAGYMHERLAERLNIFQRTLGPDDELGIHVVGGTPAPFYLRQMTFSDPDILIFTGIDSDGNNVQLLQHHSQMGIMVVVLPKIAEEPFRVGFPIDGKSA